MSRKIYYLFPRVTLCKITCSTVIMLPLIIENNCEYTYVILYRDLEVYRAGIYLNVVCTACFSSKITTISVSYFSTTTGKLISV